MRTVRLCWHWMSLFVVVQGAVLSQDPKRSATTPMTDNKKSEHSLGCTETQLQESFDNFHPGRTLLDGSCVCPVEDKEDNEAGEEVKTIRLIAPGGPDDVVYWDNVADRWSNRADEFYLQTGIHVEVIRVGFANLASEMLANSGQPVYDGYIFVPSLVGEVTEKGGLADLTEFVAGSEQVAWTDILPFSREHQAIYDNRVRLFPCDGDVLSLYYRKDLFDQYNKSPPRTWDEYTEIAKFFHGKSVQVGNETKKLVGSCVDRTKLCAMRDYWAQMVLGTIAQSHGTRSGLLFNSKTFQSNLGEALAESLRHIENQVKYGAENELLEGDCAGNSFQILDGTCAMSPFWGDVFSRHLAEGSVLRDKLGIAPTPGSPRVLDRATGQLVNCTEETCPYGVTHPDIGRVNMAPYAAFGGWSSGVAGGLSKPRERAMSEFLGFVGGKQESLKDVVLDLHNNSPQTGADPFRKSHADVDFWVSRGYPRNVTQQYLNVIEEQLSSSNTVLDIRIPGGPDLVAIFGEEIYAHLVASKSKEITHADRLAVSKRIESQWDQYIVDFDRAHKEQGLSSMKESYQKSLSVYFPEVFYSDDNGWSANQIAGLVLGCSFFVGLVIGIVAYVLSLRKIREQRRLAEQMLLERLARTDDDSENSVEMDDERDELEEIHKLSRTETIRVIIWRCVLVTVLVGTSAVVTVETKVDYLSSDQALILSLVLFAVIGISFFFYDQAVRKRTALIADNAAHANAVVTKMFPGQFRDQIIEEQDHGESSKPVGRGIDSKMKHFLNSGGAGDTGPRPLADLYLETTVLFADICGFTSWSSARQPDQVFTLLETVYSEFDQIALRRGVFKVETVGDCYVAVCGIPDPRRDHAVLMARFARDIMSAMRTLVKELELSLGPDTADLTLRIGMHSGPVTGGILRGARPRFQLFGDTMNTTARIESTSLPNKIQVSAECSDLIIAGGKEAWVKKRSNPIIAKGKGQIPTYWLGGFQRQRAMSVGSNSSYLDLSEQDLDDCNGTSEARKQRLIVWNVEQLVHILKKIVARRSTGGGGMSRKVVPTNKTLKMVRDGVSLLDDVNEIVELPDGDDNVLTQQQDHEEVEIPQIVVQEIHSFVSAVCGMYKDNAFHNFQHASAVTLSVLKLLSRIVAPSDTELGNASLHDHTYGITSDPLTQFACAFSSIIHDAEHQGIPNSQLVKENAPITRVYGKRSVAEQNSLVICWDLLMQQDYNEFRNLLCATDSELEHFRALVLNCVLATDIVDKDLKALRNARWDKAFRKAFVEPERDAINRKATIVIEHLIQASDVSHTMQHWQIYRKWNERFFRECYNNFKTGRAEVDPSIGWYKGEMGFFDFYIIPLAKKLKDCGVFGKSSDELLNYALQNRAEWEVRGEEVVAEMLVAIANVESETKDGMVSL